MKEELKNALERLDKMKQSNRDLNARLVSRCYFS